MWFCKIQVILIIGFITSILGWGAIDQFRCLPDGNPDKDLFKSIPDFEVRSNPDGSIQHKVFIFKNEKTNNPPVLLLHELPGLSPKDSTLC